ncbi:hypothetical protein GCM10028857_13450 [Salinarchaeum chitinilyticum]
MPQTRDCDYCGDEIPPGTGTMLVRTDGATIHYCSSKCEKNADLGREPRDLEWIQDEEAEELRRAEEGETQTEEAASDTEEAESDTEEAESDAEDADADATADDESDDAADASADDADEESEDDEE